MSEANRTEAEGTGRGGGVAAPAIRTLTEGSRAALWLAERRLWLQGARKRAVFRRLAPRFEPLYRALSAFPFDDLVTPLWQRFNATMERAMLPRPRPDFLRLSVIKQTMFVDARGRWLSDQLAYLERRLGPQFVSAVARDAAVGRPPLALASPPASHNTVHHLTHLARFAELSGADPATLDTVVEWGGGYGNLARLLATWRAAAGATRPLTYTIIDTPLFCALQWLYLSSVYGEPRVHVLRGAADAVRTGCFNLVPAGLARTLQPALGRAGLFVSTWALSECSPAAQDWVAGHWFGAPRLLLAFQESTPDLPHAGRIRGLAQSAGARIDPLPHPPGNSYAIR
ncbi:MAG: hypothetical protein WD749_03150 [Phycisphaerales bacterium]